jgi:serine/threonine-protein kinase RIO1
MAQKPGRKILVRGVIEKEFRNLQNLTNKGLTLTEKAWPFLVSTNFVVY